MIKGWWFYAEIRTELLSVTGSLLLHITVSLNIFDGSRGNMFFVCVWFLWDSCWGWFCPSACVRASTQRITPKYLSTEAPCRQRLGRAADAPKQSERETVGKLCIFLQPVFRCKIVLYIPLDLLWHLRLFFFFLHFSFEHFRCYGCLWNERIF